MVAVVLIAEFLVLPSAFGITSYPHLERMQIRAKAVQSILAPCQKAQLLHRSIVEHGVAETKKAPIYGINRGGLVPPSYEAARRAEGTPVALRTRRGSPSLASAAAPVNEVQDVAGDSGCEEGCARVDGRMPKATIMSTVRLSHPQSAAELS